MGYSAAGSAGLLREGSGYSHLKHVHIMTAQTERGEMLVWTSYNGIVAL